MPCACLRGWGRGLVALALLVGLLGCTLPREPAHDPEIARAVTELTVETQKLFAALAPGAGGSYAARAPLYRDLTARAETVALMAEARDVVSLAATEPGLIQRLAERAVGAVSERLPTELDAQLEDYRAATPGYMADYTRNLDRLRSHDRSATAAMAARIAEQEDRLAEHGRRVAAFLKAWAAYEAGRGPRPEPLPEAPAPLDPGLDAELIARRRAVITDVLRDALIYERTILNRSR